jgi:hypothetical protein
MGDHHGTADRQRGEEGDKDLIERVDHTDGRSGFLPDVGREDGVDHSHGGHEGLFGDDRQGQVHNIPLQREFQI